MIEHTMKIVEKKFTTMAGYEHNAEDYVMVQFGIPTVNAAMKLGREAADFISGTFTKPIKLEFEKVYIPYLLISKKRYADLYWTNPEKFDKMDTKVPEDCAAMVKKSIREYHKVEHLLEIPKTREGTSLVEHLLKSTHSPAEAN